MPECQMLVVVVPTEIKDDLVDTLMSLDSVSGFNMGRIAGFSREHSQFNLRERVVGYRDLFRFEVVHAQPDQVRLLAALEPVCGRVRSRYWIVPLLEQGHFGEGGR
jgi:hypothetical protein